MVSQRGNALDNKRALTRNQGTMAILHFVGFKDERYWNAVKTFGKPDFVHRHWDYRAQCEVCEGDVAVFANGNELDLPTVYAYDDSAYF